MASRRDILSMAGYMLLRAEKTPPSSRPLQIMVLRRRSTAEHIVRRLRRGESFENLARQFSVAASAPDGGHVGPVHLSILPPSCVDTVQKLRPGDVSDVLDTSKGYVILKV